ncbi:MAG: glycosyltransferase [Oscillospiraceae bacterium]|nr:glycosyltransferase [Oscillospiraceae bacterium]
MKIAIVHDWLTNMGGAEQVVINFKEIYKEAPIYTTFYNPDKLDDKLKNIDVRTSFLQKKKMVENHKKYFPLMPLAFENFNLNEYDVVLSSSSSCAKGVLTKPGSIHICYCHTPMRYAWEQRDDYIDGMGKLKRKLVKLLLHYMRMWDSTTVNRVDYFIANSNEVKKRIEKHYKRDAIVISPPVRCNMFNISETDEDYYFIVSRLVKYKRFDLAVQACIELGKKLIIIGDGPEKESLMKLANENIIFLGRQPDEVVNKYMSECKALIFPGEEDFGIVTVEAQSCGRPVIAYGKGGVLDSVIDEKTGIFFKEQTVESLKNAILKFEKMGFDKKEIREHALEFDESVFRKKIEEFVDKVSMRNYQEESK